MSNQDRLPIVLIISNGLGGWPEFRATLGGLVDVRCMDVLSGNYDELNLALSEGPPAVIGMGCVANGSSDPIQEFSRIVEILRKESPNGPGYKGKIIGLCECCYSQHIEVGCDEVHQFGRPAAERMLELIEEQVQAPT